MNNFYNKDLISVNTVNRDDLDLLFNRTSKMKKLVKQKGADTRLKGKIMAALFYEPSTRTFASFIAAIQRLGGGIIPLSGMQHTSIEKGESFEHTIKVFSSYADILVIRHPEKGMVENAAKVAKVPVINAGDGVGEHPSQALYDTYTILAEINKNEITIALLGDLKNGRTVHSLAKLLPKTGKKINFYFVAPEELKMPGEIKNKVQSLNSSFVEVDKLYDILGKIDILYVTRIQKERFVDLEEYERLKNSYLIDQQVLSKLKQNCLIMHPLPIVAEIDTAVDNFPRSIYLTKQLQNGLYVRMAILDLILREQ